MNSPDEDGSDRTSMINKESPDKQASTVTLSDVRTAWDQTPLHVKDSAKRWHLPLVVRLFEEGEVSQGACIDSDGTQHVSSTGTEAERSAEPAHATSPQQPLLLYTARRCSKVLAANLEWCAEKNRFEEVGPPVVIPSNYPGWFTFLTDHGADENYETIEEVASASKSISCFLSRTSVTAYYLSQTSAAGRRRFLKKELDAGDVYTIQETVTEQISQPTRTCCFSWFYQKEKLLDDFEELRFLRCLNSAGVEVLLPFEQKGVFTPIGSDEIMEKNAVYQIQAIIRLATLPIKVKLAFGQSPEVSCLFTGNMRFDEFFFEESVVACTMSRDQNVMLEFPLESEVQFVRAVHQSDYVETAEYKQALAYCEGNFQAYTATMKVLQSFDFKETQDQSEKDSSPNSSEYQQGRSLPPVPPTNENKDVNNHSTKPGPKECTCSLGKDASNQTNESGTTDPDYESIPHESSSRQPLIKQKSRKVDNQGYVVSKTICSGVSSEAWGTNKSTQRDSFCQTDSKEELQLLMRERRPQPVRPRGRNVDSGIQIDLASEGANANTADELLECLSETPAEERISAFLTDAAGEVKTRPRNLRSDMSSISSDHDNVFSPETTGQLGDFFNKMFDYNSMGEDSYSVDFPLSPAALARYQAWLRRRSRCTADVEPSWTGSLSCRSKKNKRKWVMNNANATLRRHNMRTVGPTHDGEDRDFEDSAGERLRRGPTRRPSYRRSRSEYGTIRRVTSPDFSSTPRRDWKSIKGPKSWREYKDEWDTIQRTESPDDDWEPPADLAELSVNEVALSLHYIGLQEEVVEHFIDEQIDGKQLLDLSSDLITEGFPETNALERKKIMDFIGGWRPKQS